jgi:hypothetical protein
LIINLFNDAAIGFGDGMDPAQGIIYAQKLTKCLSFPSDEKTTLIIHRLDLHDKSCPIGPLGLPDQVANVSSIYPYTLLT